MAVNNYLDIEPLSLEIADEMTEKMTDSNSFDGVILEEKLTHNIKYGFIVITHLMTFFEGFLNCYEPLHGGSMTTSNFVNQLTKSLKFCVQITIRIFRMLNVCGIIRHISVSSESATK